MVTRATSRCSGSLAFAVDHPAGFYVLDLSQPDPLEPVGSLQSASAPRFVEILDANPQIAILVGGTPYDPLRALRKEPATDDPRGRFRCMTSPIRRRRFT